MGHETCDKGLSLACGCRCLRTRPDGFFSYWRGFAGVIRRQGQTKGRHDMIEGKTILCFASGYDAPPTSKHPTLPLATESQQPEGSTVSICPRRVLYHHRTQGRGVEAVHVRGIARALTEMSITCDVLGPPGVSVEGASEPAPSHASGTLRRIFGAIAGRAPEAAFEMCELAYNFLAIPRLLIARLRHRYGLLYERYALFLFAGAMVAKLLRLPFVLEVNDSVTIDRSRPLKWRCLATVIEGWVLRRADLIVTVSKPFQTRLLQLGLDQDRVVVIPNAIDPAQWIEESPRCDATDSRPAVIVCVAAFVHWHRPEFLVESALGLLRNQSARLVMIGEGPARAAAEALASRTGCSDRVTFTGHLAHDHVRTLLCEADIAVIPHSNEHGSPMKLFEYMAAGKAVVAPACPPIMEIIDDGVTGILFEPLSVPSLSQKLRLLVEHPELRRRLGRNARQRVLAEHTWQRNAEKVLTHLVWLRSGRRGCRRVRHPS